METKSKSLLPKWKELQEILDVCPLKFTSKTQAKLERLGYQVSHKKGKHPKLYIVLDKTYVITMSTTGEANAGRQILRQIRRVYEDYDTRRTN